MLNPSVALHSRLVRPNLLTLDCASIASIIAKAFVSNYIAVNAIAKDE
ncbi:MAG: hypothetical protein KME55_06340 [Nostoc indistinguendum CM1-VF10]|nr:hypothetical protein [Nostoc indistinguendum CM1-VF10]